MSAWGVACAILGVVGGTFSLVGACLAAVEEKSHAMVLCLVLTAGFAVMATAGFLSTDAAAVTSRHRECVTVTGVDSGEGFGHTPMLFTTTGALEGTEGVVTRFRPGQHVCLVVANEPDRGDPVVVGIAK